LPSLFFIDVQKSQIEQLKTIVERATSEAVQIVPTIRARIALVNGEPFDFASREVRERQGQVGREFAVTYRPNLDENETVVAGEWWNAATNADETEVSVEEGIGKTLGVAVGDWITFDISAEK
jgi:putative ABC transport system permease protein